MSKRKNNSNDNKTVPTGLLELAKIARKRTEEIERKTFVDRGWWYPSGPTLSRLAGYCAIGSKILYNLAQEAKWTKVVAVQGKYDEEDHCWVEYKGWILDVTATQFNIKHKVYVLKKNRDRGASMYQKWYNGLKLNGWPKDQIPATYGL
jgi:phage gp46-like protein